MRESSSSLFVINIESTFKNIKILLKVKSILWQARDKPMTLLYNKEKVSRKGVKELLFGLQLAKC